ncbi:MAG: ATP-binding protein [Gammaproteobacteria bacterium]|nr:ATP-binding protein [Gammaproteobacteria bacterium]MDH5593163.1 ATP-binding protein [Gammaproteobacteria bacterium]
MLKEQTVTSGNIINVRRIIWLRLIVLASEIVALWLTIAYLKIALPILPISVILTTVITISIASLIRLRMAWPVSNKELFGQLIVDVLALTLLLYYTGGSTNPFAPLFLLPLILTAATLPGLYTWLMVILTIGCYSLLLFFYIPFPEAHSMHGEGFRLHVLGMWLGFILSALLIAGFTARMAVTVQRQNKKIATLREKQLKQEHILALGTLAAGAAHELGTPLSTMAVLLNDISPDTPLPESRLHTLQSQVDRCKNILGSISAAAGQIRAESGSSALLDEYLNDLIIRWNESRPDVLVDINLSGSEPTPRVVIDQTLEQALLNILNNAADASPDNVEVTAVWSQQELTLQVSDRGTGLSPELVEKAGEHILSTKQDGMGLGLFLTYTTLERLGGDVRIFNREGGGVICQINLPLSNIQLTKND